MLFLNCYLHCCDKFFVLSLVLLYSFILSLLLTAISWCNIIEKMRKTGIMFLFHMRLCGMYIGEIEELKKLDMNFSSRRIICERKEKKQEQQEVSIFSSRLIWLHVCMD